MSTNTNENKKILNKKTKASLGAFVLGLFMASITACGSTTMPKLRAKAEAGKFTYSDMNDIFVNFIDKVNDFSLPLIENVNKGLENKINTAYSPASLFYATAMLSNITANQDKENLLNILGVSEFEIKANIPTLFKACNREYERKGKTLGKERVDNSVWLDEKYTFNEQILDELANTFFTDSFSCNFATNNEKSNKAISDYAKDCTDGLIKPEYHFSADTAFVLLNTLYFEDVWNNEGIDLAKDEKRNFKNYDNSESNIQFYKTYYEQGKIIETDKYKSMYAQTLNGFKIDFIVPKDGVSVDELFTAKVLSEHESNEYLINEMIGEEDTYYYTNISTPEYDASFDDEILDNFYDAYKINNVTDFSSFASGADGFALSSIVHTTKVEFRKDKVRGAAATANGADATAVAPKKEVYETLIVDRSFIYTIKDPQGINLFQGVIYKL